MFTGTPTKNYGLPQWEFGNHPEFIADFNPAFEKIDSGMGETAEKADSAQEQLGVLSPLVTQHSQTLETQAQDISTLQVTQINQTHDINDVKQNVAQNAADITALEQEDHTIHETADADRENFYKVLNLVKLLPKKVYSGCTLTIGEVTQNVSVILIGNIWRLSAQIPEGAVIPSGVNNYTIEGQVYDYISITSDVQSHTFLPIIAQDGRPSDTIFCANFTQGGKFCLSIYNAGASPYTTTPDRYVPIIYSDVNRADIISAVSAIESIPPQLTTNSIIEPANEEEDEV